MSPVRNHFLMTVLLKQPIIAEHLTVTPPPGVTQPIQMYDGNTAIYQDAQVTLITNMNHPF